MITCGKNPTKLNPEMFQKENQYVFFVLSISITVELGDKELFGHPKIVPYYAKCSLSQTFNQSTLLVLIDFCPV